MRLLVVAALIALASARPDIGLDLQNKGYQGPSSYDVGHNSVRYQSGGGGHSHHSHGHNQGHGNGNGNGNGEDPHAYFPQHGHAHDEASHNIGGQSAGNTVTFTSGSTGATRFGGGGYSSGGAGSSSFSSGGGGGGFSSGGGGGGGFSSGGGGAAAGGGSAQVVRGESGFLDFSSGGGAAGSGGGKIIKPVIKAGAPIVSKSYFLHAAPDDDVGPGAEVEEREQIIRPRKHYNIVFVKAPGAGGSSAIGGGSANILPQNEEKTIVYVLTGRNDGLTVTENGDLTVPQGKAPSKPEVVFVRYNSESDAQRAISDIQSSYNTQQGASVTVLGSGNKAPSGGGSGVKSSFGGASAGGGSFRSDFGSESAGAGAGASNSFSSGSTAGNAASSGGSTSFTAQSGGSASFTESSGGGGGGSFRSDFGAESAGAGAAQAVQVQVQAANTNSFSSNTVGTSSVVSTSGGGGGSSSSLRSDSVLTVNAGGDVGDVGVDLSALGDHGYTVVRSGRTNFNTNENPTADKVIVEAVKSKEILAKVV